jgi:hypothetical protein
MLIAPAFAPVFFFSDYGEIASFDLGKMQSVGNQ